MKKRNVLKKWKIGGTFQRYVLAAIVSVMSALGVFAQDSSGGVRQSIDSASSFLSGVIGILFIFFLVRGILKRKKRPLREKNEE